jgi:hypothetical protein
LVKAQLIYFSTAAETLSVSCMAQDDGMTKADVQGIQGEIEEAATAAESDYRQSRA